MDTTPAFVGIDVSKAYLDSAIRPGPKAAARDPNDPAGIAALVSRLKPLAPTLEDARAELLEPRGFTARLR